MISVLKLITNHHHPKSHNHKRIYLLFNINAITMNSSNDTRSSIKKLKNKQ